MSLKIGVDIRALDTDYVTGVDTYLRNLLKQWLKLETGHHFILFGTKPLKDNKIVKAYLDKGHQLVVQPWPNKIFNSSLVFLKKPYLDKILQDVDIYFLPNPIFWSFSDQVPVVATFHDLAYRRLARIYSQKRLLWHRAVGLKKLSDRANQIIAVSTATKNDLEDIYQTPADKIEVVHLGVDQKYFHHQVSGPQNLPSDYILFIGSIEPRKNLNTLLEAFQILSNNFPELHLVIAGGFSPQKDHRALRMLKNKDKVVFVGPVSEKTKIALYKNTKAVVLPSLYEGFGLQIAESFAAGAPVISSLSSSMPEVSQGAAVLVNPFNATDIASAVSAVLTNSSFRDILVSRGFEIAKEYSWERTARKTLDIIEQTV